MSLGALSHSPSPPFPAVRAPQGRDHPCPPPPRTAQQVLNKHLWKESISGHLFKAIGGWTALNHDEDHSSKSLKYLFKQLTDKAFSAKTTYYMC